MYLIGLNGRLHSGKDTAFQKLNDAFGFDFMFKRVGFADKLKLSGMAELGLTQDSDEETIALANVLKEDGLITVEIPGEWPHVITGRDFWQWKGTEGGRDIFGTDFWVDALLPQPGIREDSQRSLKRLFPDVDVLVVTDVRFPNEAKRILDLGGEVWRLDADERLGPLPEGSHASEQLLPSKCITVSVNNNLGLDEFAHALRAAFRLMEVDNAHTR